MYAATQHYLVDRAQYLEERARQIAITDKKRAEEVGKEKYAVWCALASFGTRGPEAALAYLRQLDATLQEKCSGRSTSETPGERLEFSNDLSADNERIILGHLIEECSKRG